MTLHHAKRDQLLEAVGSVSSCAVAFSAGVDSTVVAKAAHLALGNRAVAVTAVSASLAEGELDEARRLAELIGIRHQVLETTELDNPDYTQNAPDRCYHCKTELYTQLGRMRETLDVEVIFSGTNADDLGDYRPGLRAADEHHVRSPLAECGFTKNDVRQLASFWELPVWDKPATPCLSSRIAYGEQVTPERLAMIDQAEQLLRSLGLSTVRVRYHQGDLARLEVPIEALGQLITSEVRSRLVEQLGRLGFKYVTLDLEGFRSGSQNLTLTLPLVSLEIDAARQPRTE